MIVHKGEEILLHDKDIIYAGSDDIEAVCEGIASLGDDILDRECMMIFRGCDADEADGERLCSAISEHFPGFEINVLEGGQSMYRWLIGIF